MDSDEAMTSVDSTDYIMIDNGKEAPKEIFNKNTKAIIWGMQPRAVQVCHNCTLPLHMTKVTLISFRITNVIDRK